MNRLLIDGSYIFCRGYYGNAKCITRDGRASGAVYGMLQMLRGIRKKFPDYYMTVVWDNEPAYRKSVYAEYKANRVDNKVSNYSDQLRDMKEGLKALSLDQAESPAEEADDVIATLTELYKKHDKVVICSADKDFAQLVEYGTVVLCMPWNSSPGHKRKDGSSSEVYYDLEAVMEHWGVSPESFVIYQALKGDEIDNIPSSVPNIKKITVEYICQKYNSLENLYKNLEKDTVLTQTIKKKFLAAKEAVFRNLRLVTLRKDLEVSVVPGHKDVGKFMELVNKYDIKVIDEKYPDIMETDRFSNRTGIIYKMNTISNMVTV